MKENYSYEGKMYIMLSLFVITLPFVGLYVLTHFMNCDQCVVYYSAGCILTLTFSGVCTLVDTINNYGQTPIDIQNSKMIGDKHNEDIEQRRATWKKCILSEYQ